MQWWARLGWPRAFGSGYGIGRAGLSLLLLGAVLLGGHAAAQEDGATQGSGGARALPPLLAELSLEFQRLHDAGAPADADGFAAGSKRLRDAIGSGALRVASDGRVQVDVRLSGAGPTPASLSGLGLSGLGLSALGVVTQIWRPDLGRAQLSVPPARLQALLAVPGVAWVDLPAYAQVARGSLTTEGDAALRADLLRQQTGLTGAGVRIGVISDGIDGLAAAQASGGRARAGGAGGVRPQRHR